MPTRLSARRVVSVSFLVDVLDVVTNLVVMWLTGSAVIFAEMAQGIADALGSALLVVGERRARRPRDRVHPLGYAREAFFWGLLSAIAMLVVGGGLSAWRGWHQLVTRAPLENSWLAIAVLTLAIGTNGYAVSLSVRKLAEEGSLREAFRDPKRPLVKSALVRDLVGTFTSVVGLAALALYQSLGIVVFDAAGALVAAVLMAAGSLVLMSQARSLITGRALPEDDLARLRAAVLAMPEVVAVNQLSAIYSGASEVLVDADLDLVEQLDTPGIEAVLDDLEARARDAIPEVGHVRVLLNSPERG
ncbi:MAG: cation diffusion facilitator family transporter [Myxococcales bacterium]|nr:cation diffusion facilitator family transporter [Myxococcales bacterium]